MHVEKIMPAARARLVTIPEDAALLEAAKRLRGPETSLVVVCNAQGAMCGVISKSDIVNRISQCSGASCTMPVAAAMTREIVRCRPGDTLRDVWGRMTTHGLKHLPVADEHEHPLGVLGARQLMRVLVEEAEQEEELLRDYVMCMGYR
jgi:CBS domain-containing protein